MKPGWTLNFFDCISMFLYQDTNKKTMSSNRDLLLLIDFHNFLTKYLRVNLPPCACMQTEQKMSFFARILLSLSSLHR